MTLAFRIEEGPTTCVEGGRSSTAREPDDPLGIIARERRRR